MVSDKSQIWLEIRKAAPKINKAGGNAIELLIWSQGRELWEVMMRINFVLDTAKLSKEEVKKRESIWLLAFLLRKGKDDEKMACRT